MAAVGFTAYWWPFGDDKKYPVVRSLPYFVVCLPPHCKSARFAKLALQWNTLIPHDALSSLLKTRNLACKSHFYDELSRCTVTRQIKTLSLGLNSFQPYDMHIAQIDTYLVLVRCQPPVVSTRQHWLFLSLSLRCSYKGSTGWDLTSERSFKNASLCNSICDPTVTVKQQTECRKYCALGTASYG